MVAVVGVGMAAGTAAGMVAGGTAGIGMEDIGIVGAGGLAMAGAGGDSAAGTLTGLGVNTRTDITTAVTAITAVMAHLPALKTKPQRFNPDWPTSVSIMARSTAKLVQGRKARSKLSRPSAA